MSDDTAARLNEALGTNDTVAFLHALDEIVRVRGTGEIASARGISVETLAEEVCPIASHASTTSAVSVDPLGASGSLLIHV